MDNFANRLETALRIRNMKPVELSNLTGIPKSAISQYRSGIIKPKQKRLFLIAEKLDVDEAWLMGLDVPMERSNTQKINDTLSDVIIKLRTDETFLNAVTILFELDAEALQEVSRYLLRTFLK